MWKGKVNLQGLKLPKRLHGVTRVHYFRESYWLFFHHTKGDLLDVLLDLFYLK